MTTYLGHSETIPTGATALPLYCEVCQERVALVAPVGVGVLAALAKAFDDHHQKCSHTARCACQWEAGDSPCPVHGEESK